MDWSIWLRRVIDVKERKFHVGMECYVAVMFLLAMFTPCSCRVMFMPLLACHVAAMFVLCHVREIFASFHVRLLCSVLTASIFVLAHCHVDAMVVVLCRCHVLTGYVYAMFVSCHVHAIVGVPRRCHVHVVSCSRHIRTVLFSSAVLRCAA